MKRSMTASLLCATLLFAAGCGGSDHDSASSSSSASKSASSSPEQSEESTDSATESVDPASPTTREQLPSTEPDGFVADDLSKPYSFDYILSYVNKYPGWVKLSTEEPHYDAALGGYVVEVYFTVEAGYDIILTKEWSLEAGGQTVVASDAPSGTPDPNGIDTWLPTRTPLGNHPESTQNYVFGDLLFVMPQTDQPLTMHYNNVDGNVNATWQKDGYGA